MKCTQCGGRAQIPLCNRCQDQLAVMLDDLSWLLHELEVTVTRQDRLAAGKSRRTEHASPVNVGAVELQRAVREELRWTIGRPTLPIDSPRLWVWWLRQHFDEIVRAPDADAVYRAVARIAGYNSPGPIHDAINKPEHRFAGECPDCGELCYAKYEDVYCACPQCGLPVDVEKNRTRTVIEYDLLPERALLQILDNLNEHVPRVRFYGWVTSGKLPGAGYLTKTGVVAHKGSARDPRVYSLSRARALRRRELAPA